LILKLDSPRPQPYISALLRTIQEHNMPKLKTKKTAAKRFKKTGTGKLKYSHMGGSHILTGKSRKQKRRLKGTSLVAATDEKRISRTIPYA
jgi:large subunit ribosomal protein L35